METIPNTGGEEVPKGPYAYRELMARTTFG